MPKQEREQHAWQSSSTSPVPSQSRKPNKESLSLTNNPPFNDVTLIGYSYGRNAVPYISKMPEKNITLRQFKSVLCKKENFRYFFKRACQDFGTSIIFEEVTEDSKVLPLWEGKIFCVIEPMDDNTTMKPNKESLSLTNNPPSNDVTVIGYCYGRHAMPYLSKVPGKNITLRQFKSMLTKKGNFRYFFKTACDFDPGVIFEEVTEDSKVLPLWEGKVFCIIESMDGSAIM